MTSAAYIPREPVLTGGFDQYVRWGLDPHSGQAFWLRQQTCSRVLGQPQTMEVTLATFQRNGRRSELVHDSERLSRLHRRQWRQHGQWDVLQHNWSSGSYLAEREQQVQSRLFTPEGLGNCRLQSLSAAEAPHLLDWPLGSVHWQPMSWRGEAAAQALGVSGSFQGGTWQAWGRMTTPGMAWVQAVHFTDRPGVSFLGIGQTLAAQWQQSEPLSLSVATLQLEEEVIQFDRWWPGPTVDAPRLDNYRWMATLVNARYRLQVLCDGGNSRLQPWLAMNDAVPGGGLRVLKMTPFASLKLRLFARGSDIPLRELVAPHCLLMTALPGNDINPDGPRAIA